MGEMKWAGTTDDEGRRWLLSILCEKIKITTVFLLWQNLGPLIGTPNFCVKKIKTKKFRSGQNLGPLSFEWKKLKQKDSGQDKI